ncbi:PTS sugar transporter subunit IIA [Nocardioides dilutus]
MAEILGPDAVVLQGSARSRDDAIDEAGRLLVAVGAVEASYLPAMHEREASVSTFMGNGLAIPHGTNEAKPAIRRTAISFVRYAEPIDWNGKPAEFVVGIAGAGDDHLTVLQRLAEVFMDESEIARLRAAASADEVLAVLGGVQV